jgi:hypothetical protein
MEFKDLLPRRFFCLLRAWHLCFFFGGVTQR